MHVGVPRLERTLDNGLRVFVAPDPTSPVVAVNLWYDVGSADEAPGARGFAHLFEHLMFQGSTNVASGEHFQLLEESGAMANATTSTERTNYFETVPIGALDLALWLEADRLAGLDISQTNLDSQRDVVAEEWRQRYENQPYGDLLDAILAQHFPDDHPYRHPTIGVMDDLNQATLADVTAFFDQWYAPDNAVLTLAGPLDESAFDKVEKYFGALSPRQSKPTRPQLPARRQRSTRVIRRAVPHDIVYLSWEAPPLNDPDFDILGVALHILGEGLTSRLHRSVVKRLELAENVGVSVIGFNRTGSIAMVSARLDEGQDAQAATTALLDEIASMLATGIGADELDKVRAHFELDWLQQLATPQGRADLISSIATRFGSTSYLDEYMTRLASLTPELVVEVARKWLDPASHYALHYLREDA